jgi:hypothetical protein
MTRSMLALAIALLVLPSLGQAQQDTTGLAPGRRIRVHQPDKHTVVGNFVAIDSASLGLETTPGDTLQIARARITGVDLSVGTKSKTGQGALSGLMYGALGGVALGLLASAGQDPNELFYVSPGAAAAGGALMFGAIGAGVGALIGSGKRTDRWEPTVWPVRVIAPGGQAGNGVALGMHLRF